MGGFNLPWGANAAPRIAGPQQGSMGGIQGPPPGTMPYQPNAVAQGAAALGQLFQQFGQMNEQKKAKDKQEFQTMMELQAAGLPVDMNKMQKLGQKVFGQYIDFKNPMPQQPQQQPQQPQGGPMPAQPNMPGMIGMSQNPQGQMGPAGGPPMTTPQGGAMPPMGGGMPPGMGPSTPPFMPSSQMPQAMPPQLSAVGGVLPPGGTPPFMPSQTQPGSQPPQQHVPLWLQMAKMAGLTKDPAINPQSAGASAIQQMAQRAQQSGQMQRGLTGMQLQGAVADFAYKQRMMGLSLAAAGIGADGQPLSEDDMYKARSILSGQKRALEGQDANDLYAKLTEARRIGARPDQMQAIVDEHLNGLLNVHKKSEFILDSMGKLMKEGVTARDSFQLGDALWNGKPISADLLTATSPQAMKEATDRWYKALETYPALASAPPEVLQKAKAMNAVGDNAGIAALMRGTPTKAQIEVQQKAQELGIQGKNAATSAGNLALGQQKFGFDQKVEAQKQQHGQAMAGITALLETYKMQGNKLADDQWKSLFSLIPMATGMAVRPTMEAGAAGHSWMTQGPSIEPNTPNMAGAKNLLGQSQPSNSEAIIDWLKKFTDAAVEFK